MTRCIRRRWPFTKVTPHISGARMLAVLATSLALVLAGLAVSVAGAADLAPGGYRYDARVGVSVTATAGVTDGRETVAAWGDAAARGGRHKVRLASDLVAPGSTRVYSSGADALEGGAVSLDDAARVATENGIDMRAIALQYESGAPSNLYGFTSMDGAGNIVRAPDGRYIVTLTDAGLSSPGSALNTIAHELNHIREISRTPGFHIPEEAGATLAGDLAELYMRGG